jgi:PAS domain S-box-containing protein
LAVLVSGWLAGELSALLSVGASALAGWQLFAAQPREAVPLLIFMAEGLALSVILGSMHRARAKLFDSDAQKAALLAENAQNSRHLAALSELATALSVALTHQEVAEVMVERGTLALGADTCTLYRRERTGDALELIGARGVARALLDRILRITPQENQPPWLAISTGKIIWAETEREYREFYPELAQLVVAGPRAKAFFCAPLLVENEPIGLLGMGFYVERAFSTEERAFVATFCQHCAQALLRAERLRRELEARSQAEQAQSLLVTTLRSIGDGVLVTNRDARVTFLNDVASQLTGWDEGDAINQPIQTVFQIVNEETRHTVESPVARVLKKGAVVGLANHTLLLAKNGLEIPIDDSAAPIRDESGNLHGAVLVFRDVSEKKRAEERRTFLANVTATLTASLDYNVTLSNLAELVVPRLADWCALEVLEEGLPGPVQVAVAHVDPEKVAFARELGRKYPADPEARVGVPQVIRSGKAEFYGQIPAQLLRDQAKDARHLALIEQLQLRSAMVVPLRARDQVLGAMTFVYAESGRNYRVEDLEFAEEIARRASVAIDNARLYVAEQNARQSADIANRAKDEFLATVSHELRTPLNAILGWAKLLVGSDLDDGKRERAAETIERNAVAMAQLIEDLIDVSRIVSGKMRIETRPVDLGAVVGAALESARPSIEAKGIRLTCKLEPQPGEVRGDPSRLQQVVWNLLSNAVKFSERGGRIDLELRRDGDTLELRVEDNGRGIAAQFLAHVFDRFRQADGRITRSYGGLGLGLSISRDIVQLHGGEIHVQSRGEGLGATFVVRLPASTGSPAPDLPSGSVVRRERSFDWPPVLRGLKVLVVDDDDDARQLVQQILEECGSQVASASNVQDALSAFFSGVPDVLVSDIGMPLEDGFDLIRQVRALPAAQGGQVPAIALTAYTRAQDRSQLLSAGYMSHVPKPVEPTELVSVVARLARAQRY